MQHPSPKAHPVFSPTSPMNQTKAFDEWFQISDDKDQHEVVQQLKSDVTRDLQPKNNPIEGGHVAISKAILPPIERSCRRTWMLLI
jgi:hypothetical protein